MSEGKVAPMSEVEGLEDMLAELRTRPDTWRLLATVEDEAIAALTMVAFGNSVADRGKPDDDSYDFAYREVEPGKWQVFACYKSLDLQEVWDLDFARNCRPD
jgi:hypothetical protein